MSPSARSARHVIVSQTATNELYDSTAAAYFQLEALVAGIATKLGDRATDRLSRLEILRQQLR
jgi:DNA-binding MurR/RpiR family transcriptional regulator